MLDRANALIDASPDGERRNPCTYAWWIPDTRKRYAQHRERREAAIREQRGQEKREEERPRPVDTPLKKVINMDAVLALQVEADRERALATYGLPRLMLPLVKAVPAKHYFSTPSFLARMRCYNPWSCRYAGEDEPGAALPLVPEQKTTVAGLAERGVAAQATVWDTSIM